MKTLFSKTAPWLGGVGMAVGQAAVATRCTIPEQGTCMGCGSCLVVIGSLVTWAIHAKKQQQTETQENVQKELQAPQPQLQLPQPRVVHSNKQQQIETQENVQNELQVSQPRMVHSRD